MLLYEVLPLKEKEEKKNPIALSFKGLTPPICKKKLYIYIIKASCMQK
jgi:hypothetical protein